MWKLHDRIEAQLNETACRFEIESIARHGQLVPALGRRLHGDTEHDVELIYGARRLFVARHLKRPLLAEIREISDREAMIAMDIENRLRRDISPYERGMSFARSLRSGCFSSQEKLASSLKISRAQVSRLLLLARLPAAIIGAFADPREICETWGVELQKALSDPHRRTLVLERARRLSKSPPPQAAAVYEQLTSMPRPGRRRRADEEVVRDGRGVPLFRMRRLRRDLAVFVPAAGLSAITERELRAALREALCESIVRSTLRANEVDSSRALLAGDPTE